ncbi:hypothetical protein ES703_56849 [subsurface metagenome]
MSVKREREKRAFQLILEAGEEGILQSEIWKRLGTDSRTGSRIAIKFERDGRIKRQRELHGGRWTYRLFSLMKPITVDSIIDCPCMVCNDINRCTPGGRVSPLFCKKFTYWIDPNTDIGCVQKEELNENNI